MLFFKLGSTKLWSCELLFEVPNHLQNDVCIMLTHQDILEDHLFLIDDESGYFKMFLIIHRPVMTKLNMCYVNWECPLCYSQFMFLVAAMLKISLICLKILTWKITNKSTGNKKAPVGTTGIIYELYCQRVCWSTLKLTYIKHYVQHRNSDRLTRGFQIIFGPKIWPQSFHI